MSTDLVQRLRSLSQGFEEWRVESPQDGSYCMSYTRDDDLRPEQAARGWLAEHLLRHPDSQFAGYVVKKHVVKTLKDQALDEAADALERLEEEAARTARNRDMWKGQCERQAAELEALRRGEFICSRCGLRKDADADGAAPF